MRLLPFFRSRLFPWPYWAKFKKAKELQEEYERLKIENNRLLVEISKLQHGINDNKPPR